MERIKKFHLGKTRREKLITFGLVLVFFGFAEFLELTKSVFDISLVSGEKKIFSGFEVIDNRSCRDAGFIRNHLKSGVRDVLFRE